MRPGGIGPSLLSMEESLLEGLFGLAPIMELMTEEGGDEEADDG